MSVTPDSAWYYVVVVLIAGNFFALIIGVLLFAAPQYLAALSRWSNRWVSTRQFSKPLAKPRPGERVLLQYPRVLGAILLASAALILIKGGAFLIGMSPADGARLLAGFYTSAGFTRGTWEMLWVSLVGFIIVGTVLAVGVGLLALFRLTTLKTWLSGINRWVSTRQATKPLEAQRLTLDQWVTDKPRLWGGVISTVALFSAVVLWVFVLGR